MHGWWTCHMHASATSEFRKLMRPLTSFLKNNLIFYDGCEENLFMPNLLLWPHLSLVILTRPKDSPRPQSLQQSQLSSFQVYPLFHDPTYCVPEETLIIYHHQYNLCACMHTFLTYFEGWFGSSFFVLNRSKYQPTCEKYCTIWHIPLCGTAGQVLLECHPKKRHYVRDRQ